MALVTSYHCCTSSDSPVRRQEEGRAEAGIAALPAAELYFCPVCMIQGMLYIEEADAFK